MTPPPSPAPELVFWEREGKGEREGGGEGVEVEWKQVEEKEGGVRG